MARKGPALTPDELVAANKILYDAINDPKSELAGVLIAGAAIEEGLFTLLSRFLINHKETRTLFNFDGPAGTASYRARLAFALGLIPQVMFGDILTLGRVRNHFAHKHGHPAFADADVIRECKKLQIVDLITDRSRPDSPFAVQGRTSMRFRFNITVVAVTGGLVGRANGLKQLEEATGLF